MWCWLWALGCRPDDTTPIPTAPETGSTAITGTTGSTGDTSVPATSSAPNFFSAGCVPTDNALRFACHVVVDPAQPVQIAFSKADGTGIERVQQDLAVSEIHDLDLYFLAPATGYAYRASAVAWPDDGEEGTLTTGVPPVDLSASLDVTGASSTRYLGTNLSCGSGANAAVFDAATGEMLWYQVADPYGSYGGYQMLTFTEDHTILGQSGSEVTEIDLAGRDVLRKQAGIDYFDTLHHDLFKHDGLYYLLYRQSWGDSSLLDGFLVWDSTGAEVGRWFSADHLSIPPTAQGDWMHTNTIFVRDGRAYLSSFAQNDVIEVDADVSSPTFGQVEWVLGGSAPEGLGNDYALDWSAVGGADGFGHQHDVHLTADGRLILLDNEDGRALVIALDEPARVGAVEESYPASAPQCGPQGTATETAAGGLLVDCSGMSLREYMPGGTEPVWTGRMVCANGNPGDGISRSPERWYPLDGW